jgi:integrase
MPRVPKMPHVEFDKSKNRYQIRLRWPVELLSTTGKLSGVERRRLRGDYDGIGRVGIGRKVFLYKFRQGVGEAEANARYPRAMDRFSAIVESMRRRSAIRSRPFLIDVNDPLWRPLDRSDYSDLADRELFEKYHQHSLVIPAPEPRPEPNEPKVADSHKVVECQYVLDEWAKERGIAPKGKRQRTAVMKRFFDRLNRDKPQEQRHTDLRRVSEPDLIGYRKHLVGSIGPKYSIVTASKELHDLRAIFRYAHEDLKDLDANPAATIKNIKARVGTRDGFDDHERALLIREAVKSDSPIIKWGNLFGGYLGLRMAEIAEAQTTDFETWPDGTVVFAIREDDRQENQRLKTEQSRRRLPIPEPIVRAGFVAYLESVICEHGHGPIFPMVKVDQDGRRNTCASNEIAEWLNKLVPDQRKTFHSWRSTTRTLLENAGVSSDRARWIVGHKPRDIDAMHYLKHPLVALAKALELLDDPLAPAATRAAAD